MARRLEGWTEERNTIPKHTLRLLEAGAASPAAFLQSAMTAFRNFLGQYMEHPSSKLIYDAVSNWAEETKKSHKDLDTKIKSTPTHNSDGQANKILPFDPTATAYAAPDTYKVHYRNSSLKPVANYVQRPMLSERPRKQLCDPVTEGSDAKQKEKAILVIRGLGGAGKSQLVLDYLQKHRQDYTRASGSRRGGRIRSSRTSYRSTNFSPPGKHRRSNTG
ncbi:MAG: hypothetical protein Q9186_001873 [Xanthomendoza sp. 1 TL-2023]